MKRKLLLLLGIMVFISAISTLFIKIINRDEVSNETDTDDRIQIVTTIYPIYLIGLNITDRIEDISIQSLTAMNTGCLHDYQLTTADMKLISKADVLIINGGGMEAFMEDIEANYPDLTIIDASKGITMLSYDTYEHDKSHKHGDEFDSHEDGSDDHEEDHENELNAHENESDVHEGEADAHKGVSNTHEGDSDDPENKADVHEEEIDVHVDEGDELEEDGHSHDHGDYNSHVWMDPRLYVEQIEAVSEQLIDYINNLGVVSKDESLTLSEIIEQNKQSYVEKITQLDKEIEETMDNIRTTTGLKPLESEAVIFHEAFAYFAKRIHMKVAFTIELDSDTSLSAGEIAHIIDDVNERDIKFLFTEEQYSDSIAKQIERETNAFVYIIDSVVTGDGAADSYLTAMRKNLEVLKKAFQM